MIFVINLLQITGALALFIFGMKVMSDGIQKAAGGQLRRTLRSVTKKPLNGLLVGLGITGLVQSSSATTVMTISLVNAGLITIMQSVGLIMGANIGTTVTAWIVSLGGFLFKLSSVTIPALTLAVPLYLRGGKRNKYWAEFLIGFCLLFIGLDFLKSSLPVLENEEVFNAIKNYTALGFGSRILFVLVGLVLTVIVQSSSAAITLTLALVFNGLIPIDLGCAMIIGENIGTTITAEIAALVGNVFARRSATVHTLFNLIGAMWMIFLLGPMLNLLEGIFTLFSPQPEPFNNAQLATLGLAAFHSTFNVLNAAILLPLIPYLVKAASFLRKPRSKKDARTRLKYLDSTIGTPELFGAEIQSRILEEGMNIEEMTRDTHDLINAIESEEQYNIHKKLKKSDKRIRDFQYRINQFIIQIAREELTETTSDSLQRYISIVNDMTRMSNIMVSVSFEIREKNKDKIWFTPIQRSNLNQVFDKLFEALAIMNSSLSKKDYRGLDISEARKLEDSINKLRSKFRSSIKSESDKFDFSIEGVLIYFRVLILLEKLGDKIFEVSAVMADN